MRDERKNNIRKARICYFEISIIILATFAFAYILYQSQNSEIVFVKENKTGKSWFSKFLTAWLSRTRVNLVSASVYNCCPILKNSSVSCQDLEAETCNSQCSPTCLPATCQQTASCKLGCCYNSNQGICDRNTPKSLCQQRQGTWKDDAVCNPSASPECKLGCCILGSNTDFVTERRCEYLSSLNGFVKNFNAQANNELACLILSKQQSVGACVVSSSSGNNCKFLSKVECVKLQGNFNEGMLCSSSSLNSSCTKTTETRCVEGKDEVYFVDSCGNLGNIYDSRKINDDYYWSYVVAKNNSCSPSSSNINSQSCGNCDYFLGSKCSLQGKKNVCINLNCNNAPDIVDAFGNILSSQDRKNGESWCVYDSAISQGKDVVGSRHWRYSCIDGQVKVEPCEDFRQGLCVESEIESDGESMSFASCRPNRWRECLNYNKLVETGSNSSSKSSSSSASKKTSGITGNSILGIFGGGDEESEGAGEKINYNKVIEKCKANSDCYLKSFDFGTGYNFVQCLPNYPPGFFLQATSEGETDKGGTCGAANFECKMIETKSMMSGWTCVAGCECGTEEYVQQMNDWCSSLGDCGADVNIAGQVTDDGYSAPDSDPIDINQYAKNAHPVKGQKADPGNITELIGMIDPGNAEDYPSEGGPIKSIPALIMAQVGKGAVAGIVMGIGAASRGGSFLGGFGSAGSSAIGAGGEPATLQAALTPGTIGSGTPAVAPSGFMGGFATVGAASLGGAAVGTLIATMFGLKGEDAYTVGCMTGSVAGLAAFASGGGFGSGVAGAVNIVPNAIFGSSAIGTPILGPLLAALPYAIIAAIILSLAFGPSEEPRETIYEFKCMQWQAPTGGDDCEKCNNDLKPCSRYRCSSLGQACELLNEGTGNELCTSSEDDGLYPSIKPWQEIVTKGYKYSNIQQDSFKLLQESNECVQEFKPVTFGVSTNEPSQCKLALNRTTNYENMNYYFGDSNLYLYNHSIIFNFPSVDSVVSSLGLNGSDASRLAMQLTAKQGDLNFYVRCQDKFGNFNQKEYVIKTCVRSGPDLTPPVINSVLPRTGSYFAYNVSSQTSTFYLSEPSDCRYSQANINYENMQYNMSCDYSIFSPTCTNTFSNLSNNNKFYVRCKDQPWLPDGNRTRNIMKENYVYELKKSSSALEIYDFNPNGTIKSGVEPITVNLRVRTRGGADGTSRCSWKLNNYEDDFASTFSTVHESVLSMMTQGDYHATVNCADDAGNSARAEWDFSLDLDSQAPKISRVYNSGTLKIATNEKADCKYSNKDCSFNWENSSSFITSDNLEHNAAWQVGLTYYIKCKDEWGNSAGCFVARTY